MPQVRTYDGRTVTVSDPQFRFPVDYIGITRGFTSGYHGGADEGWNNGYGGPYHILKTPGKVNKVRTVHDNGLYNGGYGNYITMDCDGFVVLLGHCLLGSFKVKPGDILPQGVEVCKMNNSGNSTGNHLHYEIYLPGSTASKDRIDPLPLTCVYPDQVVSPNTACKDQIRYYTAPVTDIVGNPGVRDTSKNQIEITIDTLRVRKRPELNDEVIVGLLRKGVYNVIAMVDMRHETSNGYVWYQIGVDLWIAFSEDWAILYPAQTQPDNKDKQIAELQKQNSAYRQALETVREVVKKAIA